MFAGVDKSPDRRDAFRYGDTDRFPAVSGGGDASNAPRDADADAPLGMIVGGTITDSANRIGAEIVRLVGHATVRDRTTGLARPAKPADIAILFRSRDTHREFEGALERRGVSTYVYKGLGFFDADEVQDAVALLRYLADPASNLRTATLLRSRLVRLSDAAIARLAAAPGLAAALLSPDGPDLGGFCEESRAGEAVALDVTVDLGQQVFRQHHVDADARTIHGRDRDKRCNAIAVVGIGHDRFER